MKITKLKIDKLFNYLDKDLTFNSNINLLVGINGSGKTSILNCIKWLTNLSFYDLYITPFNSLEISFILNNKNYTLRCTKESNIMTFFLNSIDDRQKFHPIKLELPYSSDEILKDDEILLKFKRILLTSKPEEHELNTWNFLKNIPKPTIIGLDRTLYMEEDEELYKETSILIRKKTSNKTPLSIAKDKINAQYKKNKHEIFNLSRSLNHKIMSHIFEGVVTLSETYSESIIQKITEKKIDKMRKRIKDYFETYISTEHTEEYENYSNNLDNYFDNLIVIIKEHKRIIDKGNNQNESIYSIINAHHFKRLELFLIHFETFEKKVKKISEKLENFLKIVNNFLLDSSKELKFKEDTFELVFQTLNKNKEILTKDIDLSKLSSGEQQILLLCTYLSFNENHTLFIIDEPELSLHVKWQQDFLKSIENLIDSNTQIILATHSPILVGNKEENAQLLVPFNE